MSSCKAKEVIKSDAASYTDELLSRVAQADFLSNAIQSDTLLARIKQTMDLSGATNVEGVKAYASSKMLIENYLAFKLANDSVGKYNYLVGLKQFISDNGYGGEQLLKYVSDLNNPDFTILEKYGEAVQQSVYDAYKINAIRKYQYLQSTNKIAQDLISNPGEFKARARKQRTISSDIKSLQEYFEKDINNALALEAKKPKPRTQSAIIKSKLTKLFGADYPTSMISIISSGGRLSDFTDLMIYKAISSGVTHFNDAVKLLKVFKTTIQIDGDFEQTFWSNYKDMTNTEQRNALRDYIMAKQSELLSLGQSGISTNAIGISLAMNGSTQKDVYRLISETKVMELGSNLGYGEAKAQIIEEVVSGIEPSSIQLQGLGFRDKLGVLGVPSRIIDDIFPRTRAKYGVSVDNVLEGYVNKHIKETKRGTQSATYNFVKSIISDKNVAELYKNIGDYIKGNIDYSTIAIDNVSAIKNIDPEKGFVFAKTTAVAEETDFVKSGGKFVLDADGNKIPKKASVGKTYSELIFNHNTLQTEILADEVNILDSKGNAIFSRLPKNTNIVLESNDLLTIENGKLFYNGKDTGIKNFVLLKTGVKGSTVDNKLALSTFRREYLGGLMGGGRIFNEIKLSVADNDQLFIDFAREVKNLSEASARTILNAIPSSRNKYEAAKQMLESFTDVDVKYISEAEELKKLENVKLEDVISYLNVLGYKGLVPAKVNTVDLLNVLYGDRELGINNLLSTLGYKDANYVVPVGDLSTALLGYKTFPVYKVGSSDYRKIFADFFSRNYDVLELPLSGDKGLKIIYDRIKGIAGVEDGQKIIAYLDMLTKSSKSTFDATIAGVITDIKRIKQDGYIPKIEFNVNLQSNKIKEVEDNIAELSNVVKEHKKLARKGLDNNLEYLQATLISEKQKLSGLRKQSKTAIKEQKLVSVDTMAAKYFDGEKQGIDQEVRVGLFGNFIDNQGQIVSTTSISQIDNQVSGVIDRIFKLVDEYRAKALKISSTDDKEYHSLYLKYDKDIRREREYVLESYSEMFPKILIGGIETRVDKLSINTNLFQIRNKAEAQVADINLNIFKDQFQPLKKNIISGLEEYKSSFAFENKVDNIFRNGYTHIFIDTPLGPKATRVEIDDGITALYDKAIGVKERENVALEGIDLAKLPLEAKQRLFSNLYLTKIGKSIESLNSGLIHFIANKTGKHWLSRLADEYGVVSFEMPGYIGKFELPEKIYNTYQGDTEQLIKQLENFEIISSKINRGENIDLGANIKGKKLFTPEEIILREPYQSLSLDKDISKTISDGYSEYAENLTIDELDYIENARTLFPIFERYGQIDTTVNGVKVKDMEIGDPGLNNRIITDKSFSFKKVSTKVEPTELDEVEDIILNGCPN